ncbi:hypothetical protein [Kiloniella sp.]|uniref:hypothetical protein n=1 Tax=Kiloniella sp. TaxID=1938587 RepID=UPI003B02A9FC
MISNYDIEWAPLLPLSIIYIILGIAALSLLSLVLLRSKGGEFRSVFMLIIAVFLGNPTLHQKTSEPLPELVMAVIDNSPSMNYEQRKSQAADALTSLHEQISNRSDLVLKTVNINGSGEEGTKLFESLNLTAEEKERLSGVFLITEGQIHDVPESLEQTNLPEGLPLHLLLAGDESRQDRRIVIEQAPAFGIIDQKIELTFRVVDENKTERSPPAGVIIRQNGEEIAEIKVPINQLYKQELVIENRGKTTFDISVEELKGEITTLNNQVSFDTNGVRDRLKVLLISGEPHSGERAWRNILKADPSVDLIHFTILRHPAKQDGTPIRELSLIAFPIHELFEVKLAEFDLIIFDQYQRQGFLPSHYLTNIVRYVEQGSALLEVGGPGYATPSSLYNTSLGNLLPAEPLGTVSKVPFFPIVTELGLRHPVTSHLPKANISLEEQPSWGRWFRQVDTDTLSGSTIMTGSREQPLLILDHFDKGRVAQFTSDHIWLWGRNIEGGGPQTELIRRLVHWLMKEPELDEETLKASLSNDQLTITRQSLSNADIPITIKKPSGEISTLTLTPGSDGASQATLSTPEPGIYTISDTTHTVVIHQALSGPEHQKVLTDPNLLRPIIEESGGGLFSLHSSQMPKLRLVHGKGTVHGQDWAGLRARKAERITGDSRRALLPSWVYLCLLLLTAFGAWYREGR